MRAITRSTLAKFVKLAGDRLTGDWVIIGGVVLPILGIDIRSTTDIDVAGPPDASQAQMLTLMDIVATLGLPVESINQAGAYFLYKIKNWQNMILLIHRRENSQAVSSRRQSVPSLEIGPPYRVGSFGLP